MQAISTLPQGWLQALGARLKDLRKSRRVSRQAAATAIEVSDETLRHYETGETAIPVDRLVALVRFLEHDLDVSELHIVRAVTGSGVPSTAPQQLPLDFVAEYERVKIRVQATRTSLVLTALSDVS